MARRAGTPAGQLQPISEHQFQDADLVGPLLDCVGHHAVNAERRQQQGDSRERPKQRQIEILAGSRIEHDSVHGPDQRPATGH